MTDTYALLGAIKENGYSISSVAKMLNLSYYGFWLKVHNRNEFKSSEIDFLVNLLGIGLEVFFKKKDDFKSS